MKKHREEMKKLNANGMSDSESDEEEEESEEMDQ